MTNYPREKWNEWARRYRERHKSEIREKAKLHYHANRKICLMKSKEWQTRQRLLRNSDKIANLAQIVSQDYKLSRKESLALVSGLMIGEGSLNFLVHRCEKTGNVVLQPAISILRVLLALYPYLVTQKDKALANLLIEFCTRKFIVGRKYTKRDFEIVLETRELNRRKTKNHIDILLEQCVKQP